MSHVTPSRMCLILEPNTTRARDVLGAGDGGCARDCRAKKWLLAAEVDQLHSATCDC